MTEYSSLTSSTFTFPLTEAVRLLTDDDNAIGDMDTLNDIFAKYSITGLTYDEESSTVSLHNARSRDECSSLRIDDLIATLAPICPDGAYCEFNKTTIDSSMCYGYEHTYSDETPYRLIVSSGTVIIDHPRTFWNDPHHVSQKNNPQHGLRDIHHTMSTRVVINDTPHELIATYGTNTIGEQDPYVSVTAELYELTEEGYRRSAEPVMCGQLHDLINTHLPILAPLTSVHLNNAITGEPMYAEANGWYWYKSTKDASFVPPEYAQLNGPERAASYLGCSPEVFAYVDGDRDAFVAAVDSLRPLWKQNMDALVELYRLR